MLTGCVHRNVLTSCSGSSSLSGTRNTCLLAGILGLYDKSTSHPHWILDIKYKHDPVGHPAVQVAQFTLILLAWLAE